MSESESRMNVKHVKTCLAQKRNKDKDVVAFLRCRTSEPHLRVLFGESMNIYVKRNTFCFFTWMFACDFDSKKLLSHSTAGGEKI